MPVVGRSGRNEDAPSDHVGRERVDALFAVLQTTRVFDGHLLKVGVPILLVVGVDARRSDQETVVVVKVLRLPAGPVKGERFAQMQFLEALERIAPRKRRRAVHLEVGALELSFRARSAGPHETERAVDFQVVVDRKEEFGMRPRQRVVAREKSVAVNVEMLVPGLFVAPGIRVGIVDPGILHRQDRRKDSGSLVAEIIRGELHVPRVGPGSERRHFHSGILERNVRAAAEGLALFENGRDVSKRGCAGVVVVGAVRTRILGLIEKVEDDGGLVAPRAFEEEPPLPEGFRKPVGRRPALVGGDVDLELPAGVDVERFQKREHPNAVLRQCDAGLVELKSVDVPETVPEVGTKTFVRGRPDGVGRRPDLPVLRVHEGLRERFVLRAVGMTNADVEVASVHAFSELDPVFDRHDLLRESGGVAQQQRGVPRDVERSPAVGEFERVGGQGILDRQAFVPARSRLVFEEFEHRRTEVKGRVEIVRMLHAVRGPEPNGAAI